MSSPDVESPLSTYSYPNEVLSTPQPEPQRSPRGFTDVRPPPRLRFRSPDLFQHILGEPPRPGHHSNHLAIDYEETMNDVNRALLSANRAIQNAQEAFQSRMSLSSDTNASREEVVDLTGYSPPLSDVQLPSSAAPAPAEDAAYDAFLSRITHPHDFGSRHSVIHNLLNEPSYGAEEPVEEDSTATYSGPDSLAGARRRFQNHPQVQFDIQRVAMLSSHGRSNTRDEEAAIRRQQHARAQWEENQRRSNERVRLEQQRQRILSSPVTSRTILPNTSGQDHPNRSRRASSPASDSDSSVEAVDLTQVDDEPSLAAALSKQRQDAITSQNESNLQKSTNSGITDGNGRTALTAYKCPICMEAPQNATTTACGHLFCHKCIIDTLKWSEQARRDDAPPSRKVKGVCPVCRKELARKEEPGHGRTLIPLEIKLISKKELKRKREEEEQVRHSEKKGKGKVFDIDDLNDEDEDSKAHLVDLEPHSTSSSSQKENRDIKRFKTEGDGSLSNDMDDLFDFGLDDFS